MKKIICQSRMISLDLLYVLIIITFFLIFSCSPRTDPHQYKKWPTIHSETVNYKVFRIKGMPCVWVSEYTKFSGASGISCDWSKYKE